MRLTSCSLRNSLCGTPNEWLAPLSTLFGEGFCIFEDGGRDLGAGPSKVPPGLAQKKILPRLGPRKNAKDFESSSALG